MMISQVGTQGRRIEHGPSTRIEDTRGGFDRFGGGLLFDTWCRGACASPLRLTRPAPVHMPVLRARKRAERIERKLLVAFRACFHYRFHPDLYQPLLECSSRMAHCMHVSDFPCDPNWSRCLLPLHTLQRLRGRGLGIGTGRVASIAHLGSWSKRVARAWWIAAFTSCSVARLLPM